MTSETKLETSNNIWYLYQAVLSQTILTEIIMAQKILVTRKSSTSPLDEHQSVLCWRGKYFWITLYGNCQIMIPL